MKTLWKNTRVRLVYLEGRFEHPNHGVSLYQGSLLQEVAKGGDVFLVVSSNVSGHSFLDCRGNAQKDGQRDQIGDGGEHPFAKFKVSNHQFFSGLKIQIIL